MTDLDMEKESLKNTLGKEHLGGGEFESGGKKVVLTLTDEGVSIEGQTSLFIEWRDIIRCHRGRVCLGSPTEVPEVSEKESSFTLHYIEKGADHVWKHAHTTLESSGADISSILQVILRKSIEDHPKRLLVVINPVSGSGRGESHYTKLVAPLFSLAQIHTEVIVSQHPKHPEEIGDTYDFSTVDGVVIVGGDGTYQQLIHTWYSRIQMKEGIDITNPVAELKSCLCPVGIIPTGTGNGLARGSYGCLDITTAALQIITGRRTSRHMLSIINDGRFIGFSAVVVANGFWSDILDKDAQSRWLGWLRYPIGILMMVFKMRREFRAQVQYKPANKEMKATEASKNDDASDQDWVTVDGIYTGVNCMPGIFRKSEATGKMKIDMKSKGLTLLLEKQCGRIQYWKWLFRMTKFRNDVFDEDFITPVEVMSYRLKILPKENGTEWEQNMEKRINIDGEIRPIKPLEITVRHHPDMMMIYGTCPMMEEGFCCE